MVKNGGGGGDAKASGTAKLPLACMRHFRGGGIAEMMKEREIVVSDHWGPIHWKVLRCMEMEGKCLTIISCIPLFIYMRLASKPWPDGSWPRFNLLCMRVLFGFFLALDAKIA